MSLLVISFASWNGTTALRALQITFLCTAQQTGTTALSDLQVTTSSEALLSGKAPTFRLLVSAVDDKGVPLPNVTYVVSENFVVSCALRGSNGCNCKHIAESEEEACCNHLSPLTKLDSQTLRLHVAF